MKNTHNLTAVIFLSISIIISSIIVSNGLHNVGQSIYIPAPTDYLTISQDDYGYQLIDKEGLALYLGIEEFEADKLGPLTYDGVTTSEIPYIQIGSKVHFSISAVDAWLQTGESIIIE